MNKIFSDFTLTKEYYNDKHWFFAIISFFTLVIPLSAYSIYLVIKKVFEDSSFRFTQLFMEFVHGLLFVPWQIKRHLDGLYFSSKELCSYRTVTSEENYQLIMLDYEAEKLEFFQDFYAGFLQIVLQLYIYLTKLNNQQESLTLCEYELVTFCSKSNRIFYC